MAVDQPSGEGTDLVDWNDAVTIAVAVFGIALAVRLACFTGLIASDDLGYAGFASQIATGTYELYPHHYALRYGVLVPLAGLFRLFGQQEWTMVLLPLLGSCVAAALTALIASRLAHAPAAWVAGLLAATFPVDVRFATILVPEPMLQAILLTGVLLFLVAQSRESAALGLLCGGVLGLAYLTKEPGIFVAVALWCVAFAQRRWRFVVSIPTGVGLVVAGELLWYWTLSGDVAFRLHAMGTHNASAMAVAANDDLSYRLFKAYPRMMVVPNLNFGLHSVVALALATLAVLGRQAHTSTVLLLAAWVVVPFLYLNFGSSSLDRYWALPLAPRYVSIVYPPVFILAGMFLARGMYRRPSIRAVSVATVAVLGVVGVGCAMVLRGTGWRTAHVARIRAIASTARADGTHVCRFDGDEGERWRLITAIVAPDVIGCASPRRLAMVADAQGVPTVVAPQLASQRGVPECSGSDGSVHRFPFVDPVDRPRGDAER